MINLPVYIAPQCYFDKHLWYIIQNLSWLNDDCKWLFLIEVVTVIRIYYQVSLIISKWAKKYLYPNGCEKSSSTT